MRVFASWSGGKDSCLALYRALKAGLKVECLFNMLNEEGSRSRSHGLLKGILDAQAEALGIPIVYGRASWESYEEEFKRTLASLKSIGIEGGVFGDINLQEHRDWVERVCDEVGVKVFEPLWNEAYEKLIGEFLDSGFQALVVSAKADLIGEEWMGKPYDQKFVEYLREHGLDLCGEKGEFHTLVTYGPIFKRHLKILETGRRVREGRWFLEIVKFSLI
jgi:uncharacterized protein (TIGR00290 family)